MVFSNEQRTQAEKRLSEVEPMIYHTVGKFIKHYGGDYDDLLSIAYAGYLSAFRRFDEERGTPFPVWVRYEVWTCMFNEFIKRTNNRKRHKQYMSERSDLLSYIIRPLADLMDELSDDAFEVVNLILSTPDELQGVIAQNGGNNRKVKNLVYSYLKDNGWQRGRILKSLGSIQEALE
jgi:hypothetical protein